MKSNRDLCCFFFLALKKNTSTRLLFSAALYLFITLFTFYPLEGSSSQQVAIILDGPSDSLKKLSDQLSSEISLLINGQGEAIVYTGDWSWEKIEELVSNAYQNPEVEFVVGLGYLTSQYLSEQKIFTKSTIATLAIDPTFQGFPRELEASGTVFFTYLNFVSSLEDSLAYFHQIFPCSQIGVVIDRELSQRIPYSEEKLQEISSRLGIQLSFIYADREIEDLKGQIEGESNALLITPLFRYSDTEVEQLFDHLNLKRIPSFSLYGRGYVEMGALGSLAPTEDSSLIARRIALNIQRILDGENAGAIPLDIGDPPQMRINEYTANVLKISLPWSIENNTIFVEGKTVARKQTSLPNVINEGLKQNLQLIALKEGVNAQLEDLWIAKSALKPLFGLGVTQRVIDKDRATFLEPEHKILGELTLSKVIYSNQLHGQVKVEKDLQAARDLEFIGQQFDFTQNIAIAYLRVLQAQTLEEIEENNVLQVQKNLDLAQYRKKAGIASDSEVFRWQSSLATAKRRLVESNYRKINQQNFLKQLLHASMEKELHLKDLSIENADWLFLPHLFESVANNDFLLSVLANHLVEIGIKESIQLCELNYRISAVNKQYSIAKRSKIAPDVSVLGSFGKRLQRSGHQSKTPLPDDTDWAAGVQLSYPIYTGGQRSSTINKLCHIVNQLSYQKSALEEQIEREIRNNLNELVSSHSAIQFSKISLSKAQKNLELISDAYLSGTVSIVDLLDAQIQDRIERQVAANAHYQYMINSIQLQRSLSLFGFSMDVEKQKWWIEGMYEKVLSKNQRGTLCN